MPEQGIPFASEAFFSSGLGFDFNPACEILQDAEAGSEVLRLRVPGPEYEPQPGQIMSLEDWPFGVISVQEIGENAYELGVQRLSVAATAGRTVQFLGSGLFELVDDATGRAVYGADLSARVSVKFREVLNR